ncbi:MAG: histidine phosphatase family protein [Chitinophagaceae bacterium]|nr:histidine phosphatase family protein [Chitinophagaceae bacterium]
MKRVLMIRHAKSSWALTGQEDFERPLNDRGHRDAPMMAERLRKSDLQIDAFISSPANRALTTAVYFAKEYGVHKKDIDQRKELYHAMPAVFFELIDKLDDSIKTAAIFSHNPGITAFVNMLSQAQIDNMPTCAVFAVKADIKHWKDFRDAVKDFWFFDYPKS